MQPSPERPARRPLRFDLRSGVLLAWASLLGVSPALAAPRVEVGSVLSGQYQLERVLGEGGMATVYAATDLRRNARVAVKWPSQSTPHSGYAAMRLMQEYQALERVAHPNVVDALRVARHQGHFYLVLELLEGESFDQLIERGPLPSAHVVQLLLPALDAVAAAHAAGIVHRDIKPANLFLGQGTDGRPVVKVLDFGLSKLEAAPNTRDPKLTSHGAILGTPRYMAPEQARSPDSVDARADVYAFGATLYEMLAGEAPLSAATTEATLDALKTQAPRPLCELAAQLPRELCAVVMKAMARDPQARFQDLHALRAALSPHAEPERVPGSAADEPDAPESLAAPRTHPACGPIELAGLGAAALLVLGLGLATLRHWNAA